MLMRGGTKRDETRPTDGAIVARTAEMLGKPLLPWQRYWPTWPARSTRHRNVLLRPRGAFHSRASAARSTLIDTEDTRNALLGPDRKIYYLAQTGKDAEKHFKDFVQQLSKSKLAPFALSRGFPTAGWSSVSATAASSAHWP